MFYIISGLPIFDDLPTQRQQVVMAASNASHAFSSRAAHIYAQAASSGLPGQFVAPTSLTSATDPSPIMAPVSSSSNGSHSLASGSLSLTAPVPLNTIQCFICDKSWQYNDQSSKLDCQQERTWHMDLVHDTATVQAHSIKRTQIKIVEDDNVAQLTEGRWLPFPANVDSLCKKLPKKITPVTTDIDLNVVGLPLASKKPLEALFDRTDNSLALKQFTRDKLLSFEKAKRQKLNLVQENSSSSIVWDEALEDLKSNYESLQAIVNYVTMTSFVDVCDKSPLGLLHVALDMYQAKTLTPQSAEKLFSIFLNMKCQAASLGKPFPTVQSIRSTAQSNDLPLSKAPTNGSTTTSTKSKTTTAAKKKAPSSVQKYCHDFNNSSCNRSQGVSCKLQGVVYLHGCNRKNNGVYCGLPHPRSNCTK